MIGSYIFIDTAAFKSGSYFKPSGRISKLFNLAEQERLHILLPEITREEWLKHFKQDASLPCEDFIRKASLLGDTHRIDEVLRAIESINANIKIYIINTFCICRWIVQKLIIHPEIEVIESIFGTSFIYL